MRAIRLHRLVQVLWLLPLFLLLLITNNIALTIDWILFPRFKKQVIKNPIFIASLPRTGTTNLLHSLTSINSTFTAMSLWEIILAPSIIQKKTYRLFWFYSPFFSRTCLADTSPIEAPHARHTVHLRMAACAKNAKLQHHAYKLQNCNTKKTMRIQRLAWPRACSTTPVPRCKS